jgi:hypothetical protein
VESAAGWFSITNSVSCFLKAFFLILKSGLEICNRQSLGFKGREIKIYYKSTERGNAKTWIPVKFLTTLL